MDLIFSSATALAEAIRSGKVSAVDVLEAHLAQIEQHNKALNAIVTLDIDGARKRAQEADEALAKGEIWGTLHGVPFTLKDAFATAGMRTTTGAPFMDHVPKMDSTIAERLKVAGGILIGKTNVAIMLADYQTSNPLFGRTNNPWDVSRTSGGSSGGAAAAVASGMTPFEVGTDLSGSIRIPAHFCGVFGLKPTENRVSLMGVVPSPQGEPPRMIRIMSSIGPIARTIDDLALIYGLIAGPDGHDTDVQPVPIDPIPILELKNLRIAVAPTLGGLPVAEAIRQATVDAARQISQVVEIVEEAALPKLDFNDDLQKAGELIGMIAGGSSDDKTSPTPLIQYFTALDRRDKSIVAWEQFFEQWDVLLCPPSMTSAFPHTEQGSPLVVDGHQEMYWSVSAHTTLFNYSGHPSVVIPYKRDADALPIGIQLVSKRWGESRLLAIAKAISEVLGGFQKPAGY